jgi:hypothetical protein
MSGILPHADLGGEVVGTAVRIGPNTRMDSDIFMALYAPNADISPADGQSISIQGGRPTVATTATLARCSRRRWPTSARQPARH